MSLLFWELLILLLLIVANGAFALAEIALVSARKSRLEQLHASGNVSAGKALELTEDPNQFLSTVQVGITLVGTIAGVFGGARLAGLLAEWILELGMPPAYAQEVALAVVVLCIAYLSLTIGELVPKRIALYNPERVACLVAGPMKRISWLAAPVVAVLSFSTNLMIRLLPLKPEAGAAVTEEDIRALIGQGAEMGVVTASEQQMVNRLLRLDDRRVSVLMTSRRDIVFLPVEATRDEVLKTVAEHRYSRYPVCSEGIDNVLGIVHLRDLLTGCTSADVIDLRSMVFQPLFVLDSTRALSLLQQFKSTGIHIAVVQDEFGGIEGLVTINDIFESIVGSLPEFDETEEPAITRRPDGSYLVDGSLPVDELRDLLGDYTAVSDDDADYETLGGFIMTHLARIPSAGDHFVHGKFQFEVMDMDDRRVDKVLIQPVSSPDNREEAHVEL